MQGCPPIQAERPKLQHVLLNLIQNAQWACSQNADSVGHITIRAYGIEDSKIAIEIKDNGLGIEKSQISKIFFHGFSTRENGNGLGLHSVESMLKQMQGSVQVASDGLGAGALFKIVLPLVTEKSDHEDTRWPRNTVSPLRISR